MNPIENLPMRTLLRIVHHRRPEDEPGIALILRLCEVSVEVRHGLEKLLQRLGLSDRSFAALVALYTLDPEPVSTADLVYHLDSPRSTVATTLDGLVHSGHVERTHDPHHRGATRLQLTPAGRASVDLAVPRFLDAAARLSRHLPADSCTVIATLCEVLQAECRATGTTPSDTQSLLL